tara:strand:- start:533 stop:715 length:183 start_codon:yes stop_codon:yes gene_type:complete
MIERFARDLKLLRIELDRATIELQEVTRRYHELTGICEYLERVVNRGTVQDEDGSDSDTD